MKKKALFYNEMIPTTFYIVRHGESTGNVQHILQGQADYPLTPHGEGQAKERAQELKAVTFDAAFSSDLMRAHRTAEIIALEHNLTVTTTKALRERHFGKHQGTTRNEQTKKVRATFDRWHMLAQAQWMKHRIDHEFETGEEMVTRFIRFIREIAVGYPGKTILAVCHGDLMRTLLVHLGWTTKDNVSIENTAYFVLESDGSDFNLIKTEGITTKRRR